ncbi:meiotic recombination protein spo11 [Diplodia corticola]|uniref:DNA topoisomerase (ATP-hydrolyzing) n=1 Tax=Diplodia corticola TaxID=236234 RepID=A0A1J9QX46_9PEZI|nr:meiotic recombination protein spo11 [Diplodia corticola]OJD32976.1 meiotic recombination protein spo11 [Diplodia corticola]
MLFDATSPQEPREEPLTDPGQSTLGVMSDETVGISLSHHLAPGDNEFMEFDTQWLGEDLFVDTEDLPMHGVLVPDDAPAVCDKNRVISDIESVFESMLDALLTGGDSLALFLKSRTPAQPAGLARGRLIRFPGRTAGEAWRFTVLIRILEIIHEALVTDCVVSKREIYYRHPALFANQAVVDRYVDDIALTFGASRSLLNVSAAAKGLVTGDLTILKADGVSVYKFNDPSGHLVPSIEDGDVMQTNAERVLVVEKEATFRSIAASKIWGKLKHSSIMVTGKGYPDLSTRIFLHKISAVSTLGNSMIPILALVDMDPDGLSIMCTYKYGSITLSHEGDSVKVPSMQWLGIKSVDIMALAESELGVSQTANVHHTEGLLSLSYRDRRKASQMLRKDSHSEDNTYNELKRNLQIMLMLNMKAELEILECRDGGLGAWLLDQLSGRDGAELL